VLDRTDGPLLLAKPFLKKLNWAEGIGKDGRPILKTLPEEANGDTYVCPGFQGATNWFSTSFNPSTSLYYLNALERCNVFSKRYGEWEAERSYMGGAARPAPGETFEKYLRAINIQTGEIAWEIPQVSGQTTARRHADSTSRCPGDFFANFASLREILFFLAKTQRSQRKTLMFVRTARPRRG
jgi:hypothetical protein